MASSNRIKNQHLLWRAGFGPMAENINSLDTLEPSKLWKLLVQTSSEVPAKIDIATNPLTDKAYMNADGVMKPADLTKEQKQMLRQQSKENIRDLNLAWLSAMINSKAQLREKMSLFWHGHFACRSNSAYFSQELLHVIRTNALGSFRELLTGVSKCPAMLQFLNNQQNRKGRPNENFAREVMELFTLGRGNYTEKDIKESARAFTGWGFDLSGNFVFRANAHDDGEKTFLGSTGNYTGDDILNLILKNQQTAKFITKKIYRYFVNEDADDSMLTQLSLRFYKSDYNILKLMEDIFTSASFFANENIGNKIKSPVELIAGIRRYLPLTLVNPESQLVFQKVLGQILFYPPNVAGWPGGKNWIDSSTLMVRLQLPRALAANDALSIKPKSDDDVNMGMEEEKRLKLGKNTSFGANVSGAEIDWQIVNRSFEKIQRTDLAEKITDSLLQSRGRIDSNLLAGFLNNESRESFIKSTIINIMSTPEYQLC